MYRVTSCLILAILVCLLLSCAMFAQDGAPTATATCNFNEDQQLVIQYQPVTITLKKSLSDQVPFGKPWAPGGKPMTLFTNTPIQLASTTLPIGAYTMFVVPDSKQWTLIVSKSTDMSGKYDPNQDLVRVAMESGELPTPEASLTASLGHIAASQCNLRIDLAKQGHFTEFKQRPKED